MRFKKGSSQSFLSILILSVLILIGIIIYLKQFRYDFSDLVSTKNAAAAPQTADLELPTPTGYIGAKTEIFGADDLYSKIDGKADLYLESGFKRLYCRIFKNSSDQNLWMEIFVYDMDTPKNALAVFGVQRRPEGEAIGIADFAYKTPDAIFLSQGKYYVEITGSASSTQLVNSMTEAGSVFIKNAGSQAGQIEELALFPKQNLIPQSFKLYVSGAYGFEGFKELYAAGYNINDESVTAFVCKVADASGAQKLANDYKAFIAENGGEPKMASNSNLKDAVFNLADEFEIVFSKGRFVSGVHGAQNQASAENIASLLMGKLPE